MYVIIEVGVVFNVRETLCDWNQRRVRLVWLTNTIVRDVNVNNKMMHFAILPRSHSELVEDTIPEILRCSLLSAILQLLALGVSNVMNFDFMISPPKDSVVRAIKELFFLGAIEQKAEAKEKCGESDGVMKGNGKDVASVMEEEVEEDFDLQLTSLGRRLSHFPLEPTLAKAILSSQEFGCTHEVVSVVSMLSVDSVTFTPRNKKDIVNATHRKFLSEDGDHVTLLNIYRAYKNNKGNTVTMMLLLLR